MNDINVVLASGSPRRRELLSLIYKDFSVIVPDTNEDIPKNASPFEVPEILAVKKALAVDAPESLVISADTVVILGDKIIGKPSSEENAFEILSSLSNKTHSVVTGVCIKYKGTTLSFSEETKVEFYPISNDEITDYIKSGEPFDKAGGYGIQSGGAIFVKRIVGDYFNVVGLPVSKLYRMIKAIKEV